jgi:hypothetical protein
VGKDIEHDMIHKVQKGLDILGNLSTANGTRGQEKPYQTFVMACSDLWDIHHRKCKSGKREVSIVT